jgi:S-DNA-T family DNA segregation ATPase FtsK/SpoIIIE
MAVKKEIIRTGWREAWGILFQALWILLLLSLMSYHAEDISLNQSPPNDPALNFIGPTGAWTAFCLFSLLGMGAYLAPLLLAVVGLMLIFKREGRVWPKAVWMFLILLSIICLLELQPDLWAQLTSRLNIDSPGGLLGRLVGDYFLVELMGIMGAGIVAVSILMVSAVLLLDVRPVAVFHYLGTLWEKLCMRIEVALAARRDLKTQLEKEEKEIAKRRRRLEEVMKEQEKTMEEEEEEKEEKAPAPSKLSTLRAKLMAKAEELKPEPKPEPLPEPEPAMEEPKEEELPPPPAPVRKPKPKPAVVEPPSPMEEGVNLLGKQSEYILPPLSLLEELPAAKDREIKGDFTASAHVLKETMAEFGIEVEVTNVERGPVVTRYELLPAPGVRVEKISGLSNNIALAMKAESVRVQAPIPGKGVVGIEVPNPKTTLVYMREIIESDIWKSGKAALPLALGKDVGGRVLVADLAEMPHMLVAGSTGSGKTVCMNSILTGLLMARTPDELRLMLIDPKIVEFSAYNHMPHLVVPVITDSKKVAIGLRWAINEMERRYKLFAKVGVRNIKGYNSRPIVQQPELFGAGEVPPGGEQEEQPPARVPYIVIVVDELADLMLVAQADIENSIARLAQLSRAVGIHMILATQRPSVNVITGTIKANFPARIAFQVAQKTDSRTILDANGADKLLGKGDMLFLPPGSSKLVRAQGTMTTDQEIHSIVEFIKKQGRPPQYETTIKEKIESKAPELPEMEEDDELINQAIEIIRQTHRASTSSLQRRLRIGYTRAARLMDVLEERGIVGPAQGSDPREILIDLDGEIPQNTNELTESQ